MNQQLLSNSLSNEQLIEEFSEELETGKVFVYFTKDTENPDFKDVYMAQKRETKRANNITASEHKLSNLEVKLKGWDLPIIVRHRDVFATQQLNEREIQPGYVFDKDICIFQHDSIKPRDEVQKENPRQNNDGKVLTTIDGFPIYRSTSIDYLQEDSVLDHTIDYIVSEQSIEEYVESLEPVAEAIA
jgi:hypothetical protein